MALEQLEILSRRPYHGGAEFGETGAYERVDGVAHFAVDPLHPGNADIVDLDKAPRGSDGRVRFQADFCLLQPIDAARGSGRLLLDVVNRGRKLVPGMFHGAANLLVPTERIPPGDGLLLRRGWSLAWCGWQWDVLRSPALMGLDAPQAMAGGEPIAGQTMAAFQVYERCADHLLADRVHAPLLAADTADPDAVLSVREWLDGPATVIARERWRFARDEGGRPVEDNSRVWLEGGFEPGLVYELTYRTAICPIQGAGLLALRDAASFLRYGGAEDGNPAAGRVRFCYGFGASQSGRVLRHFLSLGLNLDEQRRQVFDGMLIHIAGARQGEFNQRYAQPSRSGVPGFGHLMPFAFDPQTDPLTGERAGLLDRQRALGGVPRIIATNSAAEYWRGDASLLHTDLTGEADLEPPEEARVYLIAGVQHTSGALPLTNHNPLDGARGAHPFNLLNYRPVLRAAMLNLDRWVTDGAAPPPSRFPRLADGTAVPRAAVVERFRAIPGVTLPNPERLRTLRRLDLGPDARSGVGRYPTQPGEPYPIFASAVDADGNEIGGVRLPDVSVPLATYTAWNPRHPDTGGAGQILEMLGSTFPFAATEGERRAAGDPRPSIAERYADLTVYLEAVEQAARALIMEGHMLEEDLEAVRQAAAERYAAFTETAATAAAPAAGES
jgi:hypothetical protein